jgi:hypothetical protein
MKYISKSTHGGKLVNVYEKLGSEYLMVGHMELKTAIYIYGEENLELINEVV